MKLNERFIGKVTHDIRWIPVHSAVLCTVLATMCTPTLLLWFTRHNIVTNVAAYCDGDYIFRDNPTESRTPGHPVPCQE